MQVAFIGLRLVVRRTSAERWHLWALGGSLLLQFISFGAISSALAPHFSANGEVVYPGADLNAAGNALSYYHDIIYLSCFCQLVGSFFDITWFVMALIPLYISYKLFSLIGSTMFGGSNDKVPLPETEADRKRREKKERQATRAEKFSARRR